jgi:hypothetical protein
VRGRTKSPSFERNKATRRPKGTRSILTKPAKSCMATTKLLNTVTLHCEFYYSALTVTVITLSRSRQSMSTSHSLCLGTQNPKTSNRKAKFQSRLPETGIPQVIEDAMTVVKPLDKRYLWLDKHSIDQHDDDVKHIQIRNMECIYEKAYVTLLQVLEKMLPQSCSVLEMYLVNGSRQQLESMCFVPHCPLSGTLCWV